MDDNSISNSMMIPRRLGGGDEAHYTYVEEAEDDANKDSVGSGNEIRRLGMLLEMKASGLTIDPICWVVVTFWRLLYKWVTK